MNALLAQQGIDGAIIVFVIYCMAVFGLAIFANRFGRNKSFLSEFFLGSRTLGVWAFALTYAATSASGGSFIGFPSLVYTHGWSVGLWIGGYMIVPLVSMGLLAKRMNQMARKTGAITVPDVLRDRFGSPWFGIVCTAFIVFFLSFNLIAQFKGGSQIIESLLSDQPMFESAKAWVSSTFGGIPGLGIASSEPGYFVCLLSFTVIVVVYTAWGGFRAVVWTDVMQGVIMVAGVLFMLPLTLYAVGGLGNATAKIAEMTPPEHVHLQLDVQSPAAEEQSLPKASWLVRKGEQGKTRVFRTKQRATLSVGETQARLPNPTVTEGEDHSHWIPVIEITTPGEIVKLSREPDDLPEGWRITPVTSEDWLSRKLEPPQSQYAYGAGQPGTYLTLPGPDWDRAAGFLSFGLAISFFLMWNFSGSGQPSNMVRLMAFRDSLTLKRAIFTMAIYYSLIYFPLVVIFVCARVLLPGWEVESDRIMPEMAAKVTEIAGMPWLAGLLVAAPFAAVMSTMDSFLLMNASAITRDVYHRVIRPQASERELKHLTWAATFGLGLVAMIAALNPPKFLQDVIVYTGSGLSTCFLAPVFLCLYWRRFNLMGAFSSLLGGFLIYNLLYGIGYAQSNFSVMKAVEPLGLHPFLVGTTASFVFGIAGALLTAPPDEAIVRKFFYVKKET